MDPLYTDSGVFIALEGGEGAGKSTQSRMLDDWLSGLGHDAVLTREPGGTEVGVALRSIVLSHSTGDLSDHAEALIYAGDKAEHVDKVVLPALGEGRVVITDRYIDSLLAYQGAGRSLGVDDLEFVALGDVQPPSAPDSPSRHRSQPGPVPLRDPRPDRGRAAGLPPTRAPGLPRHRCGRP